MRKSLCQPIPEARSRSDNLSIGRCIIVRNGDDCGGLSALSIVHTRAPTAGNSTAERYVPDEQPALRVALARLARISTPDPGLHTGPLRRDTIAPKRQR